MKFSMILPIHNAENYMRRMLDSIKAQKWVDYELICLCDQCTDGSEEIAKEYTDIVIPVDYGCAGKTRNRGLEIAKGEWVLFADDDDWLLHEYVFPMLANAAGKNGEDILMFSFIWKDVGYTKQMDGHFAAVWNKAWRREFIGETRFSDKRYGDDADFDKAMFRKNPKVVAWDMPMYYYNYMRGGSLSDLHKKGEV